ncbi:MAG: nucleotidyl transferase AbiEii/AbiGii toxin family protein [Flavobacteriaceae bacterium]|nr:nucleotidyl transferase AbiEii/AbiGii toxin family protein [Flavobacteriaceae bacterium]
MAFSNQVIQQSTLLLDVLPMVQTEDCFALHGGTALNFFILDMPRLSVDIDLTYCPIEPFGQTTHHINQALTRIAKKIQSAYPDVRIQKKYKSSKLNIRRKNATIKIEPNKLMRGVIEKPKMFSLSPKTSQFFNKQVSMPVVPQAQIIGGKFCAALSRKLVRDLFDVQQILNEIPLAPSIKEGFFYALLSNRNRIVDNFFISIEHRQNPTRSEIDGLMETPLTEQAYQKTFQYLLDQMHEWLTLEDKTFLMEFQKGIDDFRDYHWLRFPSVERKLKHLRILKSKNPVEYEKQLQLLEGVLYDTDVPQKSLLYGLDRPYET